MSLSQFLTCRKFSLIPVFLLLFHISFAQPDFRKVDEWMQSNVKDLGGRAVLLVLKDGKIIYNHAENKLSRKQKFVSKIIARKKDIKESALLDDLTSTTRQPIASCSKWLSASLVMTFVDEGKLSLNDSVGKFLPVMTQNGKGHITIWQCLSHLTGIKAPPLKEGIREIQSAHSMNEAIETIACLPMEGQPGKTFHYSNVGLQIAAAVLEKISQKDFRTLFQERIAQPCEMEHTDFGDTEVPLPAGGAYSTAEDYLHFLDMILHEGVYKGKRILSHSAILEMQKNRIAADATIAYSPAEASGYGYGFGEWTMIDTRTSEAQPAPRSFAVTSPGLFGTFPWVENNHQYAAILLTLNINSKGRNERYKNLKKIVDEALPN